MALPVILVHPPAVSKRYLPTKFLPYGMAVIYSFLKENEVPVIQNDFLMEYLFDAPEDIDYHNPGRTFSTDDFHASLRGEGVHRGLECFLEKYGGRLIRPAGIVCFSIIGYHQFWASLLLAAYIRRSNARSVIVFGGPYITIKPPEAFTRYGTADYWVKGSGELPLLMLYRLHQGTGNIRRDEIPGIIYFEDGNLVVNPPSRMPAEQESQPDFEGLDLDRYRYDHLIAGKGALFLPYRLSKGCPSRCTFCTGRLVDRYDCKSIEKVTAELKDLSRKYGTSHFMFADASINGNPKLLSQLCERLRKELPSIGWYAYARVNGFSRELLNEVRRAGCFSLFWGVESNSQSTVNLLGKRFRIEKMHAAIEAAEALGIKSYIHLMYNTPHETMEDIARLIRFVEHYIRSGRVVLLPQRFLLEPQSLMFERPGDYGLANLERVETSPFERDEFTFEESGGVGREAIASRNRKHRRMLAGHLELIGCRNLLNDCPNLLLRRLPAQFLLFTGKHAQRSKAARIIHTLLMGSLRGKLNLREQL
jgi:radical SAM superfamily enzyme YgiQ (UPF0313 family)